LRTEGWWFALPILIVIGTAIIAWIGQQHALGIYHSLAAKG